METTLATITPDDIKALVETAPQALQLNQTSLSKALDYGQSLLAKIEQQGMSAELDQELNNYLVKLKATYENMTGRRKGITKLFDDVKAEFTRLENQIAPGKTGSMYDAIQDARNKWAAFQAEERRKAEAAARLEQQKATEKVNLKADAERYFRTGFEKFLNSKLADLQQAFDSTNLDSINDVADYIIDSENWVYGFEYFNNTEIPIRSSILTNEELQNIKTNAGLGKFDAYSAEFKTAIAARRSGLLELIPGKEAALKEAKRAEEARIAAEKAAAKAEEEARNAKNAADAEAARLKQQEAEREKALAEERAKVLAREEAERKAEAELKAKQEEADRAAKAAAEAELQKSTDMANTLFEQAANVTIPDTPAQVREGYEITVLAQPGWLLLFQLWFQQEGSKLALEKFDAKKLESIRKFCEKHAMKTGEKIDSPLISYKETFKAVTAK